MAKAHEIAIASETGAFEKGIKSGVIEPVKDAEKALRDLGDTNVGRDIDRDLAVAERATESLKDETKEAANAIEKSFRDAYRKIKSDSDDATTKMTAGFDEAKDEARSSGREAAASFGGGFDDVADFVQETLANALGGFGPMGAAAGIALAAVLGTALAQASLAQEKLEEAREAAADLASQMYENGGKLPLTDQVENLFAVLSRESKANGALQSMINDFVDFGTVLDDVKNVAELTGRPIEELVKAMAPGDIGATNKELERVNKELEKYSDVTRAEGWTPVWDEQYSSLLSYKTELETTQKAMESAKEMNDALGDTKALADLSAAWQNAAADAADYFSETEDGATSFDWSTYLSNAEETVAAADELKTRIVTLPSEIKAEAERIFAAQGAVSANEYTKSYESASAADKGRFVNAARSNGEAAGNAQAQSLQAAFGAPTLRAKVFVDVDSSRWDNYTPKAKSAVVRVIREEGRNFGGL